MTAAKPPETVVVLNDFCHVQGGASQVAVSEAAALAAAGVSVIFLGAAGPVEPSLAGSGARVICLGQPALQPAVGQPAVGQPAVGQPALGDRRGTARAAGLALWNAPARATLEDLLRGLDPRSTVVHLHGYTKALSTTPVAAARRAGFGVVCTLHDFFSACPNGALFDYRANEPCALRPLGARCVLRNCDKRHFAHKAYRVARGGAQRWLAGFPSGVQDYISLSQRSAELLRPYLPPDARMWPLENPIEVPRSPAVEVASNRSLVVVGRLEAEKGVVLAAEAARAVGMPITFVGDGELRPAVEERGARVTGWLPRAGVLSELEAARCLVFPSLWYETYGLAVAEAAARGVPAVVSDVTAPAERIVPDQTGWLFRSGDLSSLIDRLRATQDDHLVGDAGRAAYARFWARPPDPANHARELREVYRAVLGRAARA